MGTEGYQWVLGGVRMGVGSYRGVVMGVGVVPRDAGGCRGLLWLLGGPEGPCRVLGIPSGC